MPIHLTDETFPSPQMHGSYNSPLETRSAPRLPQVGHSCQAGFILFRYSAVRTATFTISIIDWRQHCCYRTMALYSNISLQQQNALMQPAYTRSSVPFSTAPVKSHRLSKLLIVKAINENSESAHAVKSLVTRRHTMSMGMMASALLLSPSRWAQFLAGFQTTG